METIKLGSKGSAVKKLQQALNIKADGIFGQTTHNILVNYQRTHNLTPDGICGKNTWASLGITDNPAIADFIDYNPLNIHITKSANRPIKYLVIHFTGNSRSDLDANNVKKVFESRQASADFVVDDDQIIQLNPDLKNTFCWAVGGSKINNNGGSFFGKCNNRNSISIELYSNCKPNTSQAVGIYNHKGWFFTQATLNNAIKLSKFLMSKYNIPKENVIRHYDVTGKLCPGVYGWNNEPLKDITGKNINESNNSSEWLKFKSNL